MTRHSFKTKQKFRDQSSKYHNSVRDRLLSIIEFICGLAIPLLVALMLNYLALNRAVSADNQTGTIKSDSGIEAALPSRIDGFEIGSPVERNNYPGVYSGVDNPDDPNREPIKPGYSVSCSAEVNGEIVVYTAWNGEPQRPELRYVNRYYSLQVIYFLSRGMQQYIYGTILNIRALTDGVPVLVESKNWSCNLFKGGQLAPIPRELRNLLPAD